jgi:hypothetical protein
MPNGYHPTPGVQVVLLSRTEQGYPRFEWQQSGAKFWAVSLVGGQSLPPRGVLRGEVDRFEGLVEATRRAIGDHWSPKDALGSAIMLDFATSAGDACGSFYVYGWTRGCAEVIHDHSLYRGPLFPPDELPEPLRGVTTSHVSAGGLVTSPGDTTNLAFENCEALLVTSFPLHQGTCWPPASPSAAVLHALAREPGKDMLLALWARREEPPGRTVR